MRESDGSYHCGNICNLLLRKFMMIKIHSKIHLRWRYTVKLKNTIFQESVIISYQEELS